MYIVPFKAYHSDQSDQDRGRFLFAIIYINILTYNSLQLNYYLGIISVHLFYLELQLEFNLIDKTNDMNSNHIFRTIYFNSNIIIFKKEKQYELQAYFWPFVIFHEEQNNQTNEINFDISMRDIISSLVQFISLRIKL